MKFTAKFEVILMALNAVCIGAFLVFALPNHSQAQSPTTEAVTPLKQALAMVKEGKKDRIIGESATGYLDFYVWDLCGVMNSGKTEKEKSCKLKPGLYEAVKAVNKVRKTQYESVGVKNNWAPLTVAEMYGKNLVKKAKPGEMARSKTGEWYRVP